MELVTWYVGEGNGTLLRYSCLENPMDGGAWWAAIHGVAKSRTRLSDFTFTFHFHALEEEMATHSSVLAWRLPGMAGPGGLPSMGSHRVGHDWSNLAAAATWYVEITKEGYLKWEDSTEKGILRCPGQGSLNHLCGTFLLGFLQPIVLLHLVLSLYLVYLRVLRCVHVHL